MHVDNSFLFLRPSVASTEVLRNKCQDLRWAPEVKWHRAGPHVLQRNLSAETHNTSGVHQPLPALSPPPLLVSIRSHIAMQTDVAPGHRVHLVTQPPPPAPAPRLQGESQSRRSLQVSRSHEAHLNTTPLHYHCNSPQVGPPICFSKKLNSANIFL